MGKAANQWPGLSTTSSPVARVDTISTRTWIYGIPAPPGDQFPTQVVVEDLGPEVRREIEKRLTRAIASPPRHLIVQSIVFAGKFEFDRRKYYPDHWSPARVIAFTRKRLPMNQPVISSPYKWVDLSIHGNTVTITQHQGTPPKGTERQTKGGKVETWGPSCI
jgi:hypothetical protein